MLRHKSAQPQHNTPFLFSFWPQLRIFGPWGLAPPRHCEPLRTRVGMSAECGKIPCTRSTRPHCRTGWSPFVHGQCASAPMAYVHRRCGGATPRQTQRTRLEAQAVGCRVTATGIPDFGDGFRPVLLCASVCQLPLNNTVHDIGPNLDAKHAAHSHRHVSGNLPSSVPQQLHSETHHAPVVKGNLANGFTGLCEAQHRKRLHIVGRVPRCQQSPHRARPHKAHSQTHRNHTP